MLKALDAGIDQFGGEICVEVAHRPRAHGQVPEDRLDDVRAAAAAGQVPPRASSTTRMSIPTRQPRSSGSSAFRAAGEAAQRRSIVLLKNDGGRVASSQGRPKLYIEGIDAECRRSRRRGRASAPGTPSWRSCGCRLRSSRGRASSSSSSSTPAISTSQRRSSRVPRLMRQVPTIVEISLDRAAVIPEIAAPCAALLASFGAGDAALMDVVFGRCLPEARLRSSCRRRWTRSSASSRTCPTTPRIRPSRSVPARLPCRQAPLRRREEPLVVPPPESTPREPGEHGEDDGEGPTSTSSVEDAAASIARISTARSTPGRSATGQEARQRTAASATRAGSSRTAPRRSPGPGSPGPGRARFALRPAWPRAPRASRRRARMRQAGPRAAQSAREGPSRASSAGRPGPGDRRSAPAGRRSCRDRRAARSRPAHWPSAP